MGISVGRETTSCPRSPTSLRISCSARLQAISRGTTIRAAYKRCIAAARCIRRAAAGWLARCLLRRVRAGVARLQATFRARRLTARFSALRAGLAALNSLARGFIARALCARRGRAASAIQRVARAFLARTRLYWASVRGALLMQVCRE